MALIEPRKLKGFRDYPPDLMRARYAVIDVIREQAHLAGFQMIATPAMEYAETLLGQGGDETDKEVYRFKDHGDREVALRFDLTVPFARFVAEHQGTLVFPFKKLQMGDVWRGEKPQKGRYREFMQCDLDIIGVDSAAADVEILATLQKILGKVADAGPFTQSVGNRVILSALIRKAFPKADAKVEAATLVALDKLAKIGAAKVKGLLLELAGSEAAADELVAVVTAKAPTGDTDLSQVRQFLGDGHAALAAVDRLVQTAETVRQMATAPQGRLLVDLSIARGLGYYTGVVFETTLDSLPGFGSVSSGGRYNDLASRFSSRELPGVGGSVGLDRLLGGLEEMQKIQKARADMAFVAVATDDAMGYAFQLAESLRSGGIACDVGLVPKLGAQFKHADRLGCPVVITVGSDERAKQTYSLKTMATGAEERDLPAAGLLSRMRAVFA
jgi:histidyl-tRNA synthetase